MMTTSEILPPRFYTRPLEGFKSRGPKFRRLLKKIWKDPRTGKPLVWEPWQEDLLDSILEVFPPEHEFAGQLRYRTVCVVVPRQSGKSLLAAALTIFGVFLHVEEPNVVGIAGKNERQALIVFKRVANVITRSPVLMQYLKRRPGEGTMSLKNGGEYAIFPADGGAVQGQPITWGVMDELHLAKSGDIWAALVIGQSAQNESLLVAITTAGDENSTTLLDLQERGRKLSANPDPDDRFGYFEWSAPDELKWDSPEAVLSCNPRVAGGHIPLDRIMDEIKNLPKAEVERYRLNRTVRSDTKWMDPFEFVACARKWPELPGDTKPLVVAVDVTPGGSYATISIAGVDEDGVTHGAVYVSIPNPATSYLVTLCDELRGEYPDLVIAVDSLRGKDLAERLVDHKVRRITLNTLAEANPWFLRAVRDRKLTHDSNGLLDKQIRKAEIKQLPKGGYNLTMPDHSDMDAIKSFIPACYLASQIADEGPESDDLFVF